VRGAGGNVVAGKCESPGHDALCLLGIACRGGAVAAPLGEGAIPTMFLMPEEVPQLWQMPWLFLR